MNPGVINKRTNSLKIESSWYHRHEFQIDKWGQADFHLIREARLSLKNNTEVIKNVTTRETV